MTAQSLAGQGLMVGVQVLLGWLLLPDDYALAALAFTVVTVLMLVQQAGVQQVLVQRQRAFATWATPAFWLSLALGLATGLIVAAAAPLAASIYQRPELVGLLLVCSISCPLLAICTVPDAALRIDMRFKALAASFFLAVVVQAAASVALALTGAGAYAIVAAPVVGWLGRAASLWIAAKRPITARPRLRRWKCLLSSSFSLLGAQVAMAITYQGGPLVLGLVHQGSKFPGLFMFAWSLSDQAMRVLVNNLQQVLFPALSKLDGDGRRQADAFLRAVRLLLLLGTPACVGLALLAAPVLRLIWQGRWDEAAPIISFLSLGMTSRMVYGPSEAMLQAQRRNRALLGLCVAYAAIFLGAVWAGAWLDQTKGAAIATAITMSAMAPVALWLALRPAGLGWIEVLRVYARPVAAVAAAAVPAWLATRELGNLVRDDLLNIAIVACCFLAIYPLAFRAIAPAQWRELMDRLTALRPRRRAATPAPADL